MIVTTSWSSASPAIPQRHRAVISCLWPSPTTCVFDDCLQSPVCIRLQRVQHHGARLSTLAAIPVYATASTAGRSSSRLPDSGSRHPHSPVCRHVGTCPRARTRSRCAVGPWGSPAPLPRVTALIAATSALACSGCTAFQWVQRLCTVAAGDPRTGAAGSPCGQGHARRQAAVCPWQTGYERWMRHAHTAWLQTAFRRGGLPSMGQAAACSMASAACSARVDRIAV